MITILLALFIGLIIAYVLWVIIDLLVTDSRFNRIAKAVMLLLVLLIVLERAGFLRGIY